MLQVQNSGAYIIRPCNRWVVLALFIFMVTPCVPVPDFFPGRQAIADGELFIGKLTLINIFYHRLVVITGLGYQPHFLDTDRINGAAAVVDMSA